MCQSLPGKSLCVRDSRKSAGVMKYCPSNSMEANCSNLAFRLVCEWTCGWWSADLARTTLTDEFLVWLFHNKQQPTPPIPTSVTRNKDVFPAKDENIAQGKRCTGHRKLWKTGRWISCMEIIKNSNLNMKESTFEELAGVRLGSSRNRWPKSDHSFFCTSFHKIFVSSCGKLSLDSSFDWNGFGGYRLLQNTRKYSFL